MSPSRHPRVSLRKQPQQDRSNDLVSAVLEAAIQVLAKEGMPRFTMARVAERAGVSVGSLYQYFPNKAAVLFRLQRDEWAHTTGLIRQVLEDRTTAPLNRLDALVHTFLCSECEEMAVRTALDDAAPFYRDAPETKEAMLASAQMMGEFIREVLPTAPAGVCTLAADLIYTTLTQAGKRFSESSPTPAEIRLYSDEMAKMFRAYLRSLQRRKAS